MLGVIDLSAEVYFVEYGVNAVLLATAYLEAIHQRRIFAIHVDVIRKVSGNRFARKRKAKQLQNVNQCGFPGSVLPL